MKLRHLSPLVAVAIAMLLLSACAGASTPATDSTNDPSINTTASSSGPSSAPAAIEGSIENTIDDAPEFTFDGAEPLELTQTVGRLQYAVATDWEQTYSTADPDGINVQLWRLPDAPPETPTAFLTGIQGETVFNDINVWTDAYPVRCKVEIPGADQAVIQFTKSESPLRGTVTMWAGGDVQIVNFSFGRTDAGTNISLLKRIVASLQII